MNLDIPKVMGILNVTPDSFYDRGKYISAKQIFERIGQIIGEGADIIDIGGYSTRPGAAEISEKEELRRLIAALEIMHREYPDFPVSIDTFRPEVAEIMIRDYGATMINDVMAGEYDNRMIDVIARYQIPYVLMHMQGTPLTMQNNPVYQDVTNDLLLFFAKKIDQIKQKGVMDYIIDPGFGFGKTLDHNYTLLKELEAFRMLEAPLMVGISRKSMIYKYLDVDLDQALNGTTALHMAALLKGADILRVHDVKEAVETVKLFTKLRK